MDVEYDSEALFGENDGTECKDTAGNAVASEEQILNDLLKKDKHKIHKQRVVRNPKLRDIELCGPNGFLELKRCFDNYTPKNKNPYDDLLVMMNRIEHWGHLLCPKMTFEDLVARVESLGDKRMVKTMLTKMRLDMPLTDEDFLANKENQDDVQVTDKVESVQLNDMDDADLFEIFDDLPSVPVLSHQATSSESSASRLTWEQLQRIEKNKRHAQELRLQREKQKNELNDFDSTVKNNDALICANVVNSTPSSSKSLIQEQESEKPEENDVMMDDSEALDFIFSSA